MKATIDKEQLDNYFRLLREGVMDSESIQSDRKIKWLKIYEEMHTTISSMCKAEIATKKSIWKRL